MGALQLDYQFLQLVYTKMSVFDFTIERVRIYKTEVFSHFVEHLTGRTLNYAANNCFNHTVAIELMNLGLYHCHISFDKLLS